MRDTVIRETDVLSGLKKKDNKIKLQEKELHCNRNIIELKRPSMFLIEGLFFKIFKIEKPEKILSSPEVIIVNYFLFMASPFAKESLKP